ncbi:unnamed protein product, partial [Ilex paraguariensis]
KKILEARSIGQGESSSRPNPKVWKLIWKLKITPKVRHFWWRACSNALATYRCKCATSPTCKRGTETVELMFLGCRWTHSVWLDKEPNPMSVLRISKQPWGQFGSIKQSEHY